MTHNDPLKSEPVNYVLKHCTLYFICWTFYNFDTWTFDTHVITCNMFYWHLIYFVHVKSLYGVCDSAGTVGTPQWPRHFMASRRLASFRTTASGVRVRIVLVVRRRTAPVCRVMVGLGFASSGHHPASRLGRHKCSANSSPRARASVF